MKNKRGYMLLLLLLCGLLACGGPQEVEVCEQFPPIYPDYTEVTIPSNIAPLNFLLRNKPSQVEVSIKGKTTGLLLRSDYKVQFQGRRWRKVLEAEKGGTLQVLVKAKVDGRWIQYAPFSWHIAEERIDPYLSYRLIEPGYEVWNALQLRERHLESFAERVIADNNLTDRSCMNCHTYTKNDPSLSFFHLRGKDGGTILNRNGELRKLDTRVAGMLSSAVYGELHPSGRYGIFSSNVIIPEFHTLAEKRLEVYDNASEIYLYDFDARTVQTVAFPVSEGEKLRTFPVFSADGRSVYYCEAPYLPLPDSIQYLKYDLHRIAFDPDRRAFGTAVDTLYSANAMGGSVCHPKASPDGNFLLYTVADYGTFPIWHQETDLQLFDLRTGERDSLDRVNAPGSDTYHSWSSGSRWFVFASKRDDGIYGKPYFAYVDRQGRAHKPFVLPQRDPAHYDYTLKSYNIPELSTGPLSFDAGDIERIYRAGEAETFTRVEEP
ncbi:hypothetical protein [Parabacteroides sp. PF5-6]|uniref:TolB family protein n=1 Tax=Parabacteroides sp. PF5-6 TaxID=1742403 RepID=UPI002405167B|nr:hypothetical protein [Parabacteroides sp. PF5-6]MDF9831427.1 hypothetical protein [Parabacteroides sp. PF5-6]